MGLEKSPRKDWKNLLEKTWVLLAVVLRDWVECLRALRVVRGRSELLLFTVLGACHVAPVHAKHSVAPGGFAAELVFAVKHNDF